ncbi:MAG TPA: hypothetical protein VIJ92_14485 [Ginsengibacter sp.]
MIQFLKKLINYFEKEKIAYMLSGSVAMSIYSLPRFTRDFDFIVQLQLKNVKSLVDYFKEGYYCDEDAIKEAIMNKSMFNIIDFASNYKADFIILKNEPYRLAEFERREQVNFLDMQINLVSPEDLIISKIAWIQEVQSDIQKEDIKILLKIKNIDMRYIRKWIATLKLNTFGLL